MLNKIEVDKKWNHNIKLPQYNLNGEETNLDVVFVIDYSLSMEENDSNQLCKELSKEFVGKLRDGKDRASVVKFIKEATLLSDLTTDKEQLTQAIDSITYDNGYRVNLGTNGSAGLKVALVQ